MNYHFDFCSVAIKKIKSDMATRNPSIHISLCDRLYRDYHNISLSSQIKNGECCLKNEKDMAMKTAFSSRWMWRLAIFLMNTTHFRIKIIGRKGNKPGCLRRQFNAIIVWGFLLFILFYFYPIWNISAFSKSDVSKFSLAIFLSRNYPGNQDPIN